jgi:dTDP-4-dehydrorhamnose 3,5-epimerase
MNFKELSIRGAYLIELNKHADERGSFARQFCKKDFLSRGIDFDIKQCSVSVNYKAGVLRGMHYQKEPFAEQKIISCLRGSCFDVIVDLRKDSDTYLKWLSFELSENDDKLIFIPPLCAHGFQALEDDTVIYYQVGEYYMPKYYNGVRWNDPKINIKWPQCKNRIINNRDKNYELL